MTITTTSEATTGEGTADEFVHLDPATIILGTNVRTDLRADKEFRKSIKERGVLEAITVYRDDQGQYVLLRGQRRTITAVEVGTPTGLIPARVVPQPDEVDRIGDQIVENIHRAGMREAEIVAGVEQLALIGASAAQITKRLSVPRPTVNAALAVTKSDQTRNRLESGDLTLEDAAVFAEFFVMWTERAWPTGPSGAAGLGGWQQCGSRRSRQAGPFLRSSCGTAPGSGLSRRAVSCSMCSTAVEARTPQSPMAMT